MLYPVMPKLCFKKLMAIRGGYEPSHAYCRYRHSTANGSCCCCSLSPSGAYFMNSLRTVNFLLPLRLPLPLPLFLLLSLLSDCCGTFAGQKRSTS
jgi:hypothetical protein